MIVTDLNKTQLLNGLAVLADQAEIDVDNEQSTLTHIVLRMPHWQLYALMSLLESAKWMGERAERECGDETTTH